MYTLLVLCFALFTSALALPNAQNRGSILSCNKPGISPNNVDSDLVVDWIPLNGADSMHYGYSQSINPLCKLLNNTLGLETAIQPGDTRTVTLKGPIDGKGLRTRPPVTLHYREEGQLRRKYTSIGFHPVITSRLANGP